MLPTTSRPPARRPKHCCAPACWAMCLSAACAAATAQESGSGRTLSVSSSLDTVLTYVYSSVRPNNLGGGDFVTQVRPGLRVSSQAGRIRGSFSYALDAIHHSQRSQGSELQNSLNASGVAEVIEGWAYVDGSANVSQRPLSALGQQSPSGNLQANDNRAEIGSVSLSPYVRGALGSVATYEARVNAAATNGRKSIAADSTNVGATVSVNSAGGGAVFGWGVLGSKQRSDFRAGRATENDRLSLHVSAAVNPELTLSVRGGQESTNVINVVSRRYDNWGLDARWTPTERTVASLATERRYFGSSHQFSLEHRWPLSSLRFSSTRGVSTDSNPNGAGQPVTLYNLFFSLFASAQPDPVLRDILVRDFLRSRGQDPNTVVGGGFVSSAATLQRREDLAWTYSGRRTTLTLQASASETGVLDTVVTQPAGGAIRQRSYTASLSHRLTPTAAASLTGSQLKTQSNAAGTELKSLSLSLTDQIGRRTTATLGARYTVFNSPTQPYREAALTASLGLRF